MSSENLHVYLKVNEVAEWLNVSPRTVWRWNSIGQIPRPVKIQGSTRWIEEELLKYLAKIGKMRESR